MIGYRNHNTISWFAHNFRTNGKWFLSIYSFNVIFNKQLSDFIMTYVYQFIEQESVRHDRNQDLNSFIY